MVWQEDEKETTQYYKNSILLDRHFSRAGNQWKKDWSSYTEMFARAFSSYVNDKLNGSDYLAGHSEMQGKYRDENGNCVLISCSPQGKDRERIQKAFDDLFAELKDRGILHASAV